MRPMPPQLGKGVIFAWLFFLRLSVCLSVCHHFQPDGGTALKAQTRLRPAAQHFSELTSRLTINSSLYIVLAR